MRNLTSWTTKLSFSLCVYLIFTHNAHAYLDPGTGSYIFQILIAVIAGSLFAIKIYWIRIKGFVTFLFSKKKKDD